MTETAFTIENFKHIGKGEDADHKTLLKPRLLPQAPRRSHPAGL